MNRLMLYPSTQRRPGFTLVELLVVIGIVAVLISILLPAIAGAINAAKDASTRSQINSIRAGITAYYNDFRAYPGPIAHENVGPGRTVYSGSENLTLGLLGGVQPGGSIDVTKVGMGPLDLNPLNSRRYNPYIDVMPGTLPPKPAGHFTDADGKPANDGPIPVFVDRYSDPLPLLYVRARKVMPPDGPLVSMDATHSGHCDLNDVIAYTGSSIGKGGHGLRQTGNPGDKFDINNINQGYAYFTDPNNPSNPRQKDTFIVISAGKDGIYGTWDDVCSFGSFRDE